MPPVYDTNCWPDFRGQSYQRRKVHRTYRSAFDGAGDQRRAMAGNNALWSYALGWRALTRAQAEALFHASQYAGGDTEGFKFLEWVLLAETNLEIGTGTGSGAITFDLKCRLKNDSSAAAALTVRRSGTLLVETTDYSVATVIGSNFVEHTVTIVAAANVNGATYTASWNEARRRRTVRLDGGDAFSLQERPGGSLLWAAMANFVETEAS